MKLHMDIPSSFREASGPCTSLRYPALPGCSVQPWCQSRRCPWITKFLGSIQGLDHSLSRKTKQNKTNYTSKPSVPPTAPWRAASTPGHQHPPRCADPVTSSSSGAPTGQLPGSMSHAELNREMLSASLTRCKSSFIFWQSVHGMDENPWCWILIKASWNGSSNEAEGVKSQSVSAALWFW